MAKFESDKGNLYDVIAIISLILAVIGVLVFPLLLIQPALFPMFDFTSKGHIGDVIGGTTAPIIGIVTALLMYIAFKAQYVANKRQWEKIKNEEKERIGEKRVEVLWRLLNDIRDDFERHKIYEKYNNVKMLKPNNENFYQATVISLDALIYDIILMQSTLIDSKKIISEEYGIVLRFKIGGLWNIISDLYQFIPTTFKSQELQDNYKRAVGYNATINKNFI